MPSDLRAVLLAIGLAGLLVLIVSLMSIFPREKSHQKKQSDHHNHH